jgi:putative transcriptional regulator
LQLQQRTNFTGTICYGFEIETLRNWETRKRQPDTTARSYLKAISNAPELIEQAYAPTPTI